MQINESYQQDIASIKSALSMVNLRQAMNQDAATVDKLLEGMDEASKEVQGAVQAHLGNNIDVLV
mgnify:CR=1 FL=1